MLTNTDATLYSRRYDPSIRLDRWVRTYLPAVWWYCNTKAGITTGGMKDSGTLTSALTVRIPDLSVKVRKGDYIVKGNCKISMQTLLDLNGEEYFCAIGINYNTFGEDPHIKVVSV